MNALPRARRAFLFGCLLGAGVPLAQADVTTQQRIAIEGIGGMTDRESVRDHDDDHLG